MKTVSTLILALATVALIASGAFAADPSGKALFQKNCAGCHAKGGNLMKPGFGLHKKDLEAHGVKTAADIVDKMRSPGPGMPKYGPDKINDKDAKKIADYILKKFK